MYNNGFYGFKNKLGSSLNNNFRSKLIFLGFGCSYVYTTGAFLHLKVSNKMTEDADRIEGMVHHFYTSKIAAHMAPYMLPVFLRKGCMVDINRVLRSEKADMAQRLYSYSALSKITACEQAVKYLAKKHADSDEKLDSNLSPDLLPFKNLIDSLMDPKQLSHKTKVQTDNGAFVYKEIDEPEMLFTVKLKAMENLLKNVDPKDRELEYEHLKKLVQLPKKYQTMPSKDMVSSILLLLFQNQRNVDKVLEAEFDKYNDFPLIKSDENPELKREDLCPVITYLYSHRFKNDSLTNVFKDQYTLISNNCDSLKALNNSLKGTFNSLPLLQVPLDSKLFKRYKTELNAVATICEISFCYAILKHLFEPKVTGGSRFESLFRSFRSGYKTSRGLLLFELFFTAQEKLIQSKYYFNNKKNPLPMSLLMALSTFGAIGALWSTHKMFFGPFLICRLVL